MNADLKDVIITGMDLTLVFNSCGFSSMAKKGEGLRHPFNGYYY
jgi:hypothetical protein